MHWICLTQLLAWCFLTFSGMNFLPKEMLVGISEQFVKPRRHTGSLELQSDHEQIILMPLYIIIQRFYIKYPNQCINVCMCEEMIKNRLLICALDCVPCSMLYNWILLLKMVHGNAMSIKSIHPHPPWTVSCFSVLQDWITNTKRKTKFLKTF